MNQDSSNQGGAMPDRIVLIDNKPFLFFSGTAYLCMNHNEAFTRLLIEGMHLYGTSYGSSRSGNFRLPVYEAAENALAEKFGAEAALTLSSGFMAAQLVIRHYETKGRLLYAPDAHPALLRTNKDFYSGDFEDWQTLVEKTLNDYPDQEYIIIANSLDPLKLREYDFSWIGRLPARQPITLILDDSHGLGITGSNGNGIYKSLSAFTNIHLVVVSSMAKALGLPGGVILADTKQISSFRESFHYTAASPMAPAYLYAFLQAASIYDAERKKLFRNIESFQKMLNPQCGIKYRKKYPVFACPDPALASYLYAKNILISSFPYPASTDENITRIIINSHHTIQDLETLSLHIHHFTDKIT